MWSRLLNTGLGLWLMASPAVLGYGSPASTNDRIVGPVIASLAVIAIAEVTRSLRRVNTVVGGWLLLAPWILGYETLPMVQSLVVGVLVIALSLVPGEVKERYGGGWRVLWKGVG
jgi:hypothetical protein